MEFKEFIEKLYACLGCGEKTEVFTKTVFESILTNEDLINRSTSTFKGYYYATSSISKFAKEINNYLDQRKFAKFINDSSTRKQVKEKLCETFGLDISTEKCGSQIASLFASIIQTEATQKKKNSETTNKAEEVSVPFKLFDRYLKATTAYYSTKKTLLYAEKPHPFYELYVCNNIGLKNSNSSSIIKNATIEKLEEKTNHIIIQGTGGIGKSMLLTHLFLSSATNTSKTGRMPVLINLKNYQQESSIVAFVLESIREFEPSASESQLLNLLEENKLILLLDGLDEIKSALMDSFEKAIDSFIKGYGGNTVVITSRPVNKFIAYSKFLLLDIEPLTLEQSVNLVKRLKFWDKEAQKQFLVALKNRLYNTHKEFASNPLLLTIMLMTYSSFGEIPAKMHVFYSMAYETMARLHDATKGSFKRPLHTGLTPEEFAKYFAEFCARTYADEVLEFDNSLFCAYMEKVLAHAPEKHFAISPKDFQKDLTDNLCIMYKEGDKFYFIHRSFQEYFCAVYFASEFDSKLTKFGKFFESKGSKICDKTFDMLYDMIPAKVERLIFLPYLEKILNGKGKDCYWSFIETVFDYLYYSYASDFDVPPGGYTTPFLYQKIISLVNNTSLFDDDNKSSKIPDNEMSEEQYTSLIETIRKEVYTDRCTMYDPSNTDPFFAVELPIKYIRQYPEDYQNVRKWIEQDDFVLKQDYLAIKAYFAKLLHCTKIEEESNALFD